MDKETCKECESCGELKIVKARMEGTMERILERMNDHDDNEKEKRRERKEENRTRKSNFIVIIIAVLGLGLSFGLWLNNFTHTSDLRLQKIETALGVENKKGY